jgi:hypothetical protein
MGLSGLEHIGLRGNKADMAREKALNGVIRPNQMFKLSGNVREENEHCE